MRRTCLLALAAALAVPGCAAARFSGVAVEAYGGASRLSPTSNASSMAEEGLGLHAGLTLALEVDYIRGSGMGAGIAYVSNNLPTDGGSKQMGLSAAQYDLASAFTGLPWDDLRLRTYMGLLIGRTERDDLLYAAYVGPGVSFHPARGHAVHLFTGPQALMVQDNADDLDYGGVGWFVRARYYRAFFKRCDVTPREAAAQSRQDNRPVECR